MNSQTDNEVGNPSLGWEELLGQGHSLAMTTPAGSRCHRGGHRMTCLPSRPWMGMSQSHCLCSCNPIVCDIVLQLQNEPSLSNG